jgi:hypothetical protein
MVLFLQILVGLLEGVLIGFIYELGYRITARMLRRGLVLRIKGFRIHHSLFGLIIILISLVIREYFLLALGFGIIVQHILVEKRFTVIDRS